MPFRTRAVVLAATLASAPLVTVPLLTSTADARICAVDAISYITPRKGATVWIPTNQVGGTWQTGGSQTRTYSEGELTARSHGSADTVGGDGGFNFAIVSASAKYDHTWNRSTTRTVSWTKSYSFTINLPQGKKSRARLYHKGYKFPTKQVVTYTNNCPTQVRRYSVVVPTSRSGLGQYLWAVELYVNRGNLKYA